MHDVRTSPITHQSRQLLETLPSAVQLARLLALSHGETGLSKEQWQNMQALEKERASRLTVQVTRAAVL